MTKEFLLDKKKHVASFYTYVFAIVFFTGGALFFVFYQKIHIEVTFLNLILILGALIGALSYGPKLLRLKNEKIKIDDNVLTGPNSFLPGAKKNRIVLSSPIEIKRYVLPTFPFRTIYFKQNSQNVCISEMFFTKKTMSDILEEVSQRTNGGNT